MGEVQLETDAGLAVITLDAPGRRNALTRGMANEFGAALDEVDGDPTIGCLIVRGAGESFCAGAHRDVLADVGADPADDDRFSAMDDIYGSFHRLGTLGVPTIAAVRGAAVGAGVNLLLATDLRVVAEDARIQSGFARIGLHPGGGHFVLAERAMGREATAALAVFGEAMTGRRAHALGLAWACVPADEVDDEALRIGRGPASRPGLSRRTVASFRSLSGPPLADWSVAIAAERSVQMWSMRNRTTPHGPA